MIEPGRKELFDQIIRIRPTLSPKKRRVADFMMEDYKRLFLMSAKEIAEKCQVSEPTITRFVMDLGFNGYGGFEQYLKGLLRDELTSVERLLKTSRVTDETATLNAYNQNTVMNLENMAKSVSEEELKNLATMICNAESVLVAGYKASATLAYYFGYLLNKIKEGVFIDTIHSWENLDYIAVHGKSLLVFVIAFPRYPFRAIKLIEYAKQYESKIVSLSDSLKSPVVNLADHYVIIDMEGFSFVDPFAHIITFLGALIHEIAYHDERATARRLSKIEDGVRRRRDFYSEEKEVYADYDPLAIKT
ncbi:MAG: MurR/RpiR family transcriptional regulator [Deltaproteobacteria bacterium]|nr:MAG: MurR/RpiR family transcriptional regulator [Deltaproteobacteria bacterium]